MNKVIVLLALGKSKKEVCRALGITQPTFHKHYFSEWEQRQAHLDRLEAMGVLSLIEGARDGKPAAANNLLKRLDKAKLESISSALAQRGDPGTKAKPKKAKPVGKKEQQQQDAEEVAGMFEPPESARPGGRTIQ